MFHRSINLPKNSVFLFGARGTGKTTLLKERFSYLRAEIDLIIEPPGKEILVEIKSAEKVQSEH